MPQQSSAAAVLMDPATEDKEEMEDMKGLREDMRDDVRTEVKGVREEVKGLRDEVKGVRKDIREMGMEMKAHLDKRVDDLRMDIQNATIIKHSRLGLTIAALVSIAVVGTFILQLLDALF